MLVGMGVLHGSGFTYVSDTLASSELPGFLKRVLPPLYLYPSVLMVILALVIVLALRQRNGQSFVLAVVAGIVAANAVLGFVLGGLLPGGVLLTVTALIGVAARQSARQT